MLPHFQQKLIVPTASHPLISRPALYARLDTAITTRQLVTLAAPAGWGKTTVLAQWAAQTALPVAWYTLDRTDHDLQLFVHYLLSAVAAYVPDAASVLRLARETAPQAMGELLQHVAGVIAQAPAPFALVLDDAHILEEETSARQSFNQIFELLGSITEYAPNCHLVLASRTLPTRQGLARMVVQQRAAIFDYSTLQFQAAEVQQLAELSGLERLDIPQAERLTAQLEGWIAGIALALDNMGQQGYDPFSNHALDLPMVYDYFAEQISAPLPAPLLRFLEDTSVLESLSPQRCDQLLGPGVSRPYFDALQHHTLFFSRRGNWLSLHSLFRDFLRSRLARDPERSVKMLRRAGDLYRAEDDLERAIDAYLAAGSTEEATTLLREAAPRYLQHSRQLTLLTCFERLTEAYRQNSRAFLPADLLLSQARVFRDLAEWQRAELAIQLAERSADTHVRHEAQIMAAEMYVLRGDLTRAQAILSNIQPQSLTAGLSFIYWMTAGSLAVGLQHIDDAIKAFEQAQTLASNTIETANDLGIIATITDNLGYAYIQQSNWPAAITSLRRADACWQANGNLGRRTMTLNNLGVVLIEMGNLAEARTAFETGRELAQRTGRRREELYLLASMADLLILEGEFAQALSYFIEGFQLASQTRISSLEAMMSTGAFWVAALIGDHKQHQHWQQVGATLKQHQSAETRARFALAQALAQAQAHQVSADNTADIAGVVQSADLALPVPERGFLLLLQAYQALETGGWTTARPFWESFESTVANLAEPMMIALLRPFPTLVTAAATVSPLAGRFALETGQGSAVRWIVKALGSFYCEVDGKPCSLSAMHRALLVRLLDAGTSGISIERLWQDVWGDDDVSMAALHTSLSRLRSVTKLVVVARDGICTIQSPLNEISYDVWDLERILAKAPAFDSAQQAIACYRGDFLPGEVPSATLWADARRAQLQQRYLDSLERAAEIVARDTPEDALTYYQHVLQIDPCREQTAAQVMRLAARCGKRSLVTTTFELLNTALRSLGTAPDPAVTELYSTLSRSRQTQTASL